MLLNSGHCLVVAKLLFDKAERDNLSIACVHVERLEVNIEFEQSYGSFRGTWHFIPRHLTLFGPMTLP